MKKVSKVLLIAYYWPPSGGAGVQRWLKMTYYLAEMGVEVHVLTVDPEYASYMQLDASLERDIHPRVKVHKTKSFEPVNYYAKLVGKEKVPTGGFANIGNTWRDKLALAIRSNFFIPDPRIGWKRHAVAKATELIKKFQIDTILTTSPPQSVQLIGLALRKKLPVRWISDFRDPWTNIYYYPILRHSKLSAAIDRRLERRVLSKADYIITASNGIKEHLSAKVPERPATTFTLITNGYDARDFSAAPELPPFSGFIVAYTGTMSDQYSPEWFLRALSVAQEQRPGIKMKLLIVGQVSEKITRQAQVFNVTLEQVGTVPHDRVNDYQRRADALLLAIPMVRGGEGIIPGKLFEYLAARRPIISIGLANAEAGQILEKTKAGLHFHQQQEAALIKYILQIVDGDNLPEPDEECIAAYSRKALAQRVRDLILLKE